MATQEGDTTQGFTRVDESMDPHFFIEFLETRKTIEGEREVKLLILETLDLKPGARVLDVGCGIGDDAREIAGLVGVTGKVVGIDPSEALITESRRKAVGSPCQSSFSSEMSAGSTFPTARSTGSAPIVS